MPRIGVIYNPKTMEIMRIIVPDWEGQIERFHVNRKDGEAVAYLNAGLAPSMQNARDAVRRTTGREPAN